jgi:hypothetical protein
LYNNEGKESIEFIKKAEGILKLKIEKTKSNIFDICMILNQISKNFKIEGNYIKWYTSIGLNKDEISEYKKRYDLFSEFPLEKEFIISLSNHSVKILTRKNVTYDKRKEIIAAKIWKATEIIERLEPIATLKVKIFPLKRKAMRIKTRDQLMKVKAEIMELKNNIEEVETIMNERETEIRNDELLVIEKEIMDMRGGA